MSITIITETESLGGIKKRVRFSITGAHKASLAKEALAALAKEHGLSPQAEDARATLEDKLGEEAPAKRATSYVALRCALPYVREHKLAPLFNPEPVKPVIEGIFDKTDLAFDVDIFVMPAVKLSSYEPVYLKGARGRITEEQVNAQIMREMNRFATYKDAPGPAAEGDCLQVNLSTMANGAPDMGLSGDGLAIALSRDVMPLGFVEAVVGMNTGDHREFEFDNLESDGGIVHYRCAVDLIDKKHRITPELTDEFVATRLSESAKTVAEFKDAVRGYLEKRADPAKDPQLEARLDEELSKRLQGSIPDELIERTAQGIMESIRQNAEAQGMTIAQFAQAQGADEQQFAMNVMRQARESLRQGFALEALFAHHGMEIDDADEKAALAELAPGAEETARKNIADNDAWYLVRNLARRLKAHQWLVRTAVIE